MITPTHEILRSLTSPVVAITSQRGDERNGMIANSAMRASLSADKPRVSVYVHKFNYSHDMIYNSGKFVLHILHRGQMEVVYALGFQSLRDGEKLSSVPHHAGDSGLPVLDDCYAFFECDVINVMDTGASTLFLGGVTQSGHGGGAGHSGFRVYAPGNAGRTCASISGRSTGSAGARYGDGGDDARCCVEGAEQYSMINIQYSSFMFEV